MKKMNSLFKKGNWIFALFILTLGCFILFQRSASTHVLVQLIGIILLLYGFFILFLQGGKKKHTLFDSLQLLVALIVLLLGGWIWMTPSAAAPIIPILLALLLLIHSFQNLFIIWTLRHRDRHAVLFTLLILLILGVSIFLLIQPIKIQDAFPALSGLTLTGDGVLGLVLEFRASHFLKKKENPLTESTKKKTIIFSEKDAK